jgi:transcriptional regulator with XRE-family HTH domain
VSEGNQGTKSDVASWLDEEMKRRGWSQSELARRTGLSRGTVNKYLRPLDHPHHRDPDFASLARIAAAFGLPALTAAAAATGLERDSTSLQDECVELVRRIPDHVLAMVVHQLRPLADPTIQRSIREVAQRDADATTVDTRSSSH